MEKVYSIYAQALVIIPECWRSTDLVLIKDGFDSSEEAEAFIQEHKLVNCKVI